MKPTQWCREGCSWSIESVHFASHCPSHPLFFLFLSLSLSSVSTLDANVLLELLVFQGKLILGTSGEQMTSCEKWTRQLLLMMRGRSAVYCTVHCTCPSLVPCHSARGRKKYQSCNCDSSKYRGRGVHTPNSTAYGWFNYTGSSQGTSEPETNEDTDKWRHGDTGTSYSEASDLLQLACNFLLNLTSDMTSGSLILLYIYFCMRLNLASCAAQSVKWSAMLRSIELNWIERMQFTNCVTVYMSLCGCRGKFYFAFLVMMWCSWCSWCCCCSCKWSG